MQVDSPLKFWLNLSWIFREKSYGGVTISQKYGLRSSTSEIRYTPSQSGNSVKVPVKSTWSSFDLKPYSVKTILVLNCSGCVVCTKQTATWCNWPSIIWVINVNSYINHHLPFSSDDHLGGMRRTRVRQRDGGSAVLWQVEVLVGDVTFLSRIPISKDTWYLCTNGRLARFVLLWLQLFCSFVQYSIQINAYIIWLVTEDFLDCEVMGTPLCQRPLGLVSVFVGIVLTNERTNAQQTKNKSLTTNWTSLLRPVWR